MIEQIAKIALQELAYEGSDGCSVKKLLRLVNKQLPDVDSSSDQMARFVHDILVKIPCVDSGDTADDQQSSIVRMNDQDRCQWLLDKSALTPEQLTPKIAQILDVVASRRWRGISQIELCKQLSIDARSLNYYTKLLLENGVILRRNGRSNVSGSSYNIILHYQRFVNEEEDDDAGELNAAAVDNGGDSESKKSSEGLNRTSIEYRVQICKALEQAKNRTLTLSDLRRMVTIDNVQESRQYKRGREWLKNNGYIEKLFVDFSPADAEMADSNLPDQSDKQSSSSGQRFSSEPEDEAQGEEEQDVQVVSGGGKLTTCIRLIKPYNPVSEDPKAFRVKAQDAIVQASGEDEEMDLDKDVVGCNNTFTYGFASDYQMFNVIAWSKTGLTTQDLRKQMSNLNGRVLNTMAERLCCTTSSNSNSSQKSGKFKKKQNSKSFNAYTQYHMPSVNRAIEFNKKEKTLKLTVTNMYCPSIIRDVADAQEQTFGVSAVGGVNLQSAADILQQSQSTTASAIRTEDVTPPSSVTQSPVPQLKTASVDTVALPQQQNLNLTALARSKLLLSILDQEPIVQLDIYFLRKFSQLIYFDKKDKAEVDRKTLERNIKLLEQHGFLKTLKVACRRVNGSTCYRMLLLHRNVQVDDDNEELCDAIEVVKSGAHCGQFGSEYAQQKPPEVPNVVTDLEIDRLPPLPKPVKTRLQLRKERNRSKRRRRSDEYDDSDETSAYESDYSSNSDAEDGDYIESDRGHRLKSKGMLLLKPPQELYDWQTVSYDTLSDLYRLKRRLPPALFQQSGEQISGIDDRSTQSRKFDNLLGATLAMPLLGTQVSDGDQQISTEDIVWQQAITQVQHQLIAEGDGVDEVMQQDAASRESIYDPIGQQLDVKSCRIPDNLTSITNVRANEDIYWLLNAVSSQMAVLKPRELSLSNEQWSSILVNKQLAKLGLSFDINLL
ncbi:hypothetical protein MP228_010280 [Amoeboaphelidium protococcarum]|nr:hypothetical protein MP228_010280 [Amoeboaphelidium protococcarum]